ncbi:MAG TPA: hypothetical protein VJ600_07835 [Holophagaceae bacterium]|nr:hypothetical protein [Holophagaceae bacterium]
MKSWSGHYSYNVSATGVEGKDNEINCLFEGDFTLTQNAEQPNWWDGTIQNGHGRAHLRTTLHANCVQNEIFDAAGPTASPDPDSDTPEIRLYVYPGVWRVHMTKVMLPGTFHRSGCGSDFTMRSFVACPVDAGNFPLPDSGTTLEQHFKAAGVVSGTHGIFQHLSWEGEIHLYPIEDDLELEVSSQDYATWRPSAVSSKIPGNGISVTATLKRKSGAPANIAIERMEWELVDTSREPGIAINYPLDAHDSDPDLKFDPKPGQNSTDPDRQHLTSPSVEQASDTVTILPYDWGAWSTLHVSAYLANGQRVVGKLQGSGEEDIRLPRRRKQSLIADAWREQTPGAGGGDMDEVKRDPVHGGYPGDGLTLYEKYRGFYEKGKHAAGDPSTRELFVRDKTEGRVEGGIRKFEKESGIKVHRLDADEFDAAGRVVNQNHVASPHVVDQHGVLITFLESTGNAIGSSGAYMATVPQGAASPGDVKYLLVPQAMPPNPAAADGTPYFDVSFAHELLHAVGVRHHGEGDYDAYWKIEGAVVREFHQQENGDLTGAGTPIRILRADGTDATAAFIAKRSALGGEKALGQKQSIGVKNGQASGDDTCMMRYDRNSAYLMPGHPEVRILVQPSSNPEPVGFTICKQSQGTGINAPPPSSSRYGDATRGRCSDQVRVSDRR